MSPQRATWMLASLPLIALCSALLGRWSATDPRFGGLFLDRGNLAGTDLGGRDLRAVGLHGQNLTGANLTCDNMERRQ
jgi:uncharacterized protein YjbI with pentapeptide repeats